MLHRDKNNISDFSSEPVVSQQTTVPCLKYQKKKPVSLSFCTQWKYLSKWKWNKNFWTKKCWQNLLPAEVHYKKF